MRLGYGKLRISNRGFVSSFNGFTGGVLCFMFGGVFALLAVIACLAGPSTRTDKIRRNIMPSGILEIFTKAPTIDPAPYIAVSRHAQLARKAQIVARGRWFWSPRRCSRAAKTAL